MRCPIDNRALTEIEYEGCIIHACDHCGGELVSGDALNHIINTREQRFASEFTQLTDDCTPMYGQLSDERQRNLACPCCEAPMQTVNYAGDTAVFVDRCPSCASVWLDEHELEMVQAILERWADKASGTMSDIADRLEDARRQAAAAANRPVNPSRFAFANAVMTRIIDAA